MLCFILLHYCYLVCNNSQHYRLNICLYEVVGSLSKCVKLLLDAKKITDVLNYRLGCRFDLDQWWCFFQSGLCCCIAGLAHLRHDSTTSKRQKLWLRMRYHCKAESTCFAMVCNTIHLNSK